MTAQTGRPLTVMSGLSSGSDMSQTGLGRDRAFRTNGNAYGSGGCSTTAPCVDFLNVGIFSQPVVGTFGNVGKGSLRWPGYYSWDMGFFKDIKAGERYRIQLRGEFFNIFNRVNFKDTTASVVDGMANLNQRTFGTLRNALDPRIGQLAVKVFF